jgi:hypothetical protein
VFAGFPIDLERKAKPLVTKSTKRHEGDEKAAERSLPASRFLLPASCLKNKVIYPFPYLSSGDMEPKIVQGAVSNEIP